MSETMYDDLLRTARELRQFQGYLDTQEQKEQLKVQARFNARRNGIAYQLLSRQSGTDRAADVVVRDFQVIRADTTDYLIPVVDHAEAELLQRIEAESRKSPLRRRIVRWAPVAAIVVALLVYVGVRLVSGVPVNRPLETRVGIEQRAAAFQKAVRYQQWTDTRRNRLFVELLLWPIAPTDAETKAAADFAGLVLGGRSALAQSRLICGAPGPKAADTPIDDTDLQFMKDVADHIRQPAVLWLTPPAFTLLVPIRRHYPCR